MSKRIYADHAATTPLMPKALEAMLPFMSNDFGNPSSLHGWTDLANKAIEDARATIAECINAESEEIFFTRGGTEANEWVIKGSSGGILTSSYEHHTILNAVASEADKGRAVDLSRTEQAALPLRLSGKTRWQCKKQTTGLHPEPCQRKRKGGCGCGPRHRGAVRPLRLRCAIFARLRSWRKIRWQSTCTARCVGFSWAECLVLRKDQRIA